MRWPENWRAAGGAWCFCLGGARFVFLLLLLATAFEFPNSQKKWNVFSPSSLISACAPLYFFSCWKLRAAAAMTERGRTTAARRRRAAGTEPAESESKEQTNVEKTETYDVAMVPLVRWARVCFSLVLCGLLCHRQGDGLLAGERGGYKQKQTRDTRVFCHSLCGPICMVFDGPKIQHGELF